MTITCGSGDKGGSGLDIVEVTICCAISPTTFFIRCNSVSPGRKQLVVFIVTTATTYVCSLAEQILLSAENINANHMAATLKIQTRLRYVASFRSRRI